MKLTISKNYWWNTTDLTCGFVLGSDATGGDVRAADHWLLSGLPGRGIAVHSEFAVVLHGASFVPRKISWPAPRSCGHQRKWIWSVPPEGSCQDPRWLFLRIVGCKFLIFLFSGNLSMLHKSQMSISSTGFPWISLLIWTLFCEESSAGMHDTGDLSAAPRRGAGRWKDEPAAHPIGDRNDHHVSRLDGSAHSAAPQKHRLHPRITRRRSPSQAHDHGMGLNNLMEVAIKLFHFLR